MPVSTSGRLILPSYFTFENKRYPLSHVYAYAFLYTNITELIFPPTLEYLGHGACEGIIYAELIDLSATKITFLGNFTFSRCYSLKRLLLPETVTQINPWSFDRTKQLRFIEISPKMKEMKNNFCPECALDSIFYCGNEYNGLIIPAEIKHVYVPHNYKEVDFAGVIVNRTSFNCHYQNKICTKDHIIPSYHIII